MRYKLALLVAALVIFSGGAFAQNAQPQTPSQVAAQPAEQPKPGVQQDNVPQPNADGVLTVADSQRPDAPAAPTPIGKDQKLLTPEQMAKAMEEAGRAGQQQHKKKAPDFVIERISCADRDCHGVLRVRGVALPVEVGTVVLRERITEIRPDGMCLLAEDAKGKCHTIDYNTGTGD